MIGAGDVVAVLDGPDVVAFDSTDGTEVWRHPVALTTAEATEPDQTASKPASTESRLVREARYG